MNYFFDTSALVKLLHRESGSHIVSAIANIATNRIFLTRLAKLELNSVAAINFRARLFTTDDVRHFRQEVATMLVPPRVITLRLRDDDYATASNLVVRYGETHRLRSLDALHLASAMLCHARSGIDYFVTSDKSLAAVARLEQFAVINPDEAQ